MLGDHIVIDLSGLEFDEGGNTIWVHSACGGTTLRIKCTGKIIVAPGCINPVAHADVKVDGDITICMPDDIEKEGMDAHG